MRQITFKEAARDQDLLEDVFASWRSSTGTKVAATCVLPSVSKAVLQGIYTRAATRASFLDYEARCKSGRPLKTTPRKALPGEPPVPRSVWKGAAPAIQRAMFRHFRGLGWGPREGKRCRKKLSPRHGGMRQQAPETQFSFSAGGLASSGGLCGLSSTVPPPGAATTRSRPLR